MKRLLPFLLLGAMLQGCQKSGDKPEVPPTTGVEQQKYDVQFSVADFSKSVAPMNATVNKATMATTADLKSYADYFAYRVYNANKELVNSINQTSSAANFGTVSDKLPPGTYTVILTASKVYMPDISYTGLTMDVLSYWNDLFGKKVSLVVSNSAISETTTLERLVGGLEVNITDAMPKDIGKISILIQTENQFILHDNTKPFPAMPATKNFIMTSADAGATNKSFMLYVGNTFTATNIVIRAYDVNGGFIAEKTVPNVTFAKNQKTVLTGNLFTATNTTAGLASQVNPDWTATSTPIKF